jgi:hypothetical protein
MANMKRFVSKEQKAIALFLVVIFTLMLLTETGMALLLLFMAALTGIILRIEERPPRWLLRTPLRRWLRR